MTMCGVLDKPKITYSHSHMITMCGVLDYDYDLFFFWMSDYDYDFFKIPFCD